jgi:hypothetical protein
LLDVAKEIRDSTEAISFRKWLSELNKVLASGYEAGILKANAELKKLESIVDGWLKTGDFKQGIEYERRKFNIGEIPKIGWIVKNGWYRLDLSERSDSKSEPSLPIHFSMVFSS